MAISFQPVTVGTTATILPQIPPGPCQVSFSSATGMFLGGSAVTTLTGFPVPANVPYTIVQLPSSSPTTIYAVGASAATMVLMFATDR